MTLLYGLDFTRFYDIKGVQQPRPPKPSNRAAHCLNAILPELKECRTDSLTNWNVTDYSALGDVCCAQWDNIECDLDASARSECSAQDLEDVNYYFSALIDFYDTKTCKQYPRGATHCLLPTLVSLAEQKQQLDEDLNNSPVDPKLVLPPQPLPDPLALDCFGTLNPIVRVGCRQVAAIKWNITRHSRPPVRNICCATWDDIDCLDDIVKIKCPRNEVTAIENYFNKLENWLTQIACSKSSYHSANCSHPLDTIRPYEPLPTPADENRGSFNGPDIRVQLDYQEVDMIFPAPKQSRSQQAVIGDDSAVLESGQLNADYRNFMVHYMMAVMPHMLNLMALLAVILVVVICIQCFIMARQVKHERYFKMINDQGYQKLNI
ncbi:unnamed protein product [Medioppia subpectinata]|uniref:Uncharacterized protein n=1 Tax=Medioppia subpectinata TaxID=1979941 RepID=A0A7R9KSL2_9ACAR|nr:unnamed protein product [Medioppia subpectinata]CAG2109103.1 unnamed protein product [Medioppia subpectinata]